MQLNTLRYYLAAALASSILASSANAADDDAIARCARIASTGDRILCLENALRQQEGNLVEVKKPQVADSESIATVPESVAEAEPAEIIDIAAGTADAPTESQIEQFGAPEKTKKANEIDAINVSIVKVSNNAYGKFIYRTDSGQVWIQIDKRTTRYREIPFPAQIRRAAAGSFFLQPENGGIAIRVNRTN